MQGTMWVSEGESECPISEFMSLARLAGFYTYIWLRSFERVFSPLDEDIRVFS